jgi:Flp pilus assembly protein TadD
LKDFQNTLVATKKDSTKEIKDITISAYASPDGPVDLNANLAEKRKESANKYFNNELKRTKLNKEIDENIFKYLTTAEDWDGFKKLMENSNIRDKELVLRVLSMYSDPVVREREIRNISAAFDEIKEQILPQLRRSRLIIDVNNIGKSDDQLISAATSNPESLNLEELLYAATLTQDMNQKLNIYQAAAKKFPDDVRARNNVGYALINLNRLDEAQTALNAARQVNDNDVVKNNLGVVALRKGDMKTAEDLFTSAMGAGQTVSYNLGIIKIMQGNYTDAINYFGNANEVNAALAKLLAKQNDAALTTLNNIKSDDPMVPYLKAIVGARTGNTDLMYNNLRSAVGKSADLKANAKTDMEFGKYFNEDTFKSIVQ